MLGKSELRKQEWPSHGRGGMGDERGSDLRSLLRSIDAPPLGAGGTDDLGGATTSTWIGGKRYDVV